LSPWRLAASYEEEAASSSEPPNAAWVLGQEEESDVDQDGVSLRRLQDFQADAAFLEEQVAKWLDDEWIPQECHRDVARIAAGVYLKVIGVELDWIESEYGTGVGWDQSIDWGRWYMEGGGQVRDGYIAARSHR
jgi:hypothetical protein